VPAPICGALRLSTVNARVFLVQGRATEVHMGSNRPLDARQGDNRAASALVDDTQRGRLLAGMAATVARRGYAGTPVAEVLKVAGVSRRTFYEQFADKEDCFLAAYDAIVARCTERLVAAYHAGADWEDGIARAYEALLGVLAAEPDFAHLGVVDVLAAGPRALARREAALRRFARFVDFTRERADDAVNPPPLVGQAIVGGIHELVYSHLVRGETDRLPELTGDLLHYTFMLVGITRRMG
jgi:AcrR family transcriptional regulator